MKVPRTIVFISLLGSRLSFARRPFTERRRDGGDILERRSTVWCTVAWSQYDENESG